MMDETKYYNNNLAVEKAGLRKSIGALSRTTLSKIQTRGRSEHNRFKEKNEPQV